MNFNVNSQMKLLVFLLLSFFGFSQSISTALDSLAIEADYFYGSNSNYYFSKSNAFFSIDKNDKKTYFDSQLGKLDAAIVTNPLQIILFYKDFNTLVFLDNQLNETTRIEGNKSENNLIFDKIGLAQKNNFWFYEPNVQKIGLYNFKNDTFKFISTFLDQPILFATSFYNNYYWITNDYNLNVISVYGKITALGNIPDFDQFQLLTDSEILFSKDNVLYHYNLKTEKRTPIEISEKMISNFDYKDEILTIFTNHRIVNYQIKLP